MKKAWLHSLLVILLFIQTGCATHTKKIATGMLIGGIVGAGVGYQFVHHGQNREYQTQNTIITAIISALLTGGVLAWHHREMENLEVQISGRYSRYRLCDPAEMGLAKQLDPSADLTYSEFALAPAQIGKYSIYLDDSTRWAYPTFRKRFLPPDRGETQLLSGRYIWEIVRPGSFVTRSQNPQYFVEGEEKK